MPSLQPVRGTHDLLPEDLRKHKAVVDPARNIASVFGYDEATSPIFEFSEVFLRTLGDASDIVTKETYTFEDRSGDSLTLRPEGTAALARAFMSNGLKQDVPVKWFYYGPMFRHERPQKGRLRQFHQIGAECIGIPSAKADVEVIALGAEILDELGLLEHCVLNLNTLGDSDSRKAWRDALVAYFGDHKDKLSEDSLTRLEKNPLRILDSKDKGDQAIAANAPAFDAYLNDESRAFFDEVKAGLDALGIPYTLNPNLVRGLDYYSHTCFEFITEKLGAQGTVLAGGRYDGLMEMMGGQATPAIGWAAGVERLALLKEELGHAVEKPAAIAVVPVNGGMIDHAWSVTWRLRRAGLRSDQAFSGNMGKRMKRADKINAVAAVIIGDDEWARGTVMLRDFKSGEQTEIALDDLEDILWEKLLDA